MHLNIATQASGEPLSELTVDSEIGAKARFKSSSFWLLVHPLVQ